MSELNQNSISSAERVYAESLLQMADAENKLSDVAKEMEDLAELLESQPDLRRLLGSRVLSVEERAASIERIFKGRTSDLVYRFLRVVNDKGRLGDLLNISRAFEMLHDAHSGIVEADVWTAKPLDSAHAQGVTERLAAALKRQVVLHQYVEPSLIGGFKLRIGDEVIDGSVAAQLKIMREKMIAAGAEKARTQAGNV